MLSCHQVVGTRLEPRSLRRFALFFRLVAYTRERIVRYLSLRHPTSYASSVCFSVTLLFRILAKATAPQIRKKLQVATRNRVKHIPRGKKNFFGETMFDQGHPQVELLTKMFGISLNRQARNFRRYRSGVAVATLPRLAISTTPYVV